MDFELRLLWGRLEEAERWLARGGSNDGDTLYDSLGRVARQMIVAVGYEEELSRVQRVREALDRSGPRAQYMIGERLAGIDFSSIWHILMQAVGDIAFYLGGSIALGSASGAAVGALIGGVGALPGAVAGAGLGGEIGGWILAFLGLKSLAEGLIDTLPEAARCYREGVLQAWGETHWEREYGSSVERNGNIQFAAAKIARGHVLLIVALLMAMVAYLTRGKGNRSLLLKQIRESKRLGPKIAEWLEKNEKVLTEHPNLKARERPRAASEEASSRAMTPSQVRKAMSERKSQPRSTPSREQLTNEGNAPENIASKTHRQTGASGDSSAADEAYASIRSSTTDVDAIAQNTGFKPGNVQKVKDHLFNDEHLLDRYESLGVPSEMRRFDSSADISAAWQRLESGTQTPADIQLLKHETAEAWYMRQHGPSYNAAHSAAQGRYPSPLE